MQNLNNHKKNLKLKPAHKLKNCSRVCVSLCTTVVHNTAQNSSALISAISKMWQKSELRLKNPFNTKIGNFRDFCPRQSLSTN